MAWPPTTPALPRWTWLSGHCTGGRPWLSTTPGPEALPAPLPKLPANLPGLCPPHHVSIHHGGLPGCLLLLLQLRLHLHLRLQPTPLQFLLLLRLLQLFPQQLRLLLGKCPRRLRFPLFLCLSLSLPHFLCFPLLLRPHLLQLLRELYLLKSFPLCFQLQLLATFLVLFAGVCDLGELGGDSISGGRHFWGCVVRRVLGLAKTMRIFLEIEHIENQGSHFDQKESDQYFPRYGVVMSSVMVLHSTFSFFEKHRLRLWQH